MVNKNKTAQKITKKKIWFAILYVAILCLGLALSYYFWIAAGLARCGIFGCESPYGIDPNPHGVQLALFLSGISAAAGPLIIYFISKMKWWWLIAAAALLVLIPVIGASKVGVDFNGNPLSTGEPKPGYIVE